MRQTTSPKTKDQTTYTVVFNGDITDYATLRVTKFLSGRNQGKQMLEILTGDNNDRNFTPFAYINQYTGEPAIWSTVQVPNRWRSAAFALLARLGSPTKVADMQRTYAMMSGRCCKCARKLTVPASLHDGMGPDCAGRSHRLVTVSRQAHLAI